MLLNTNYYWVNQIPTKMNHVMDYNKTGQKTNIHHIQEFERKFLISISVNYTYTASLRSHPNMIRLHPRNFLKKGNSAPPIINRMHLLWAADS